MIPQDYRLTADYRLKNANDFKQVFLNPIKSTDRYFTLLAITSEFSHPRIGLAIAKKIIKKAVHRNVIKRIVRESFRLRQWELGSIDIVVLARKEAADATTEKLSASLTRHWDKLAVKCASC